MQRAGTKLSSRPKWRPLPADRRAPDTAQNYAVGLKGAIGGRLRYSSFVHRVDWHDFQLDAFAPITGIQIVVNGKDARSEGVEFEVEELLTDRLSATLGGSYTDARLTRSFITANFAGQKDNPLPLVPKSQLTLALDYVLPLAQKRALSFHLDGSYRSAVNTAVNDLQSDGAGGTMVDLYATNFRELGGFNGWRCRFANHRTPQIAPVLQQHHKPEGRHHLGGATISESIIPVRDAPAHRRTWDRIQLWQMSTGASVGPCARAFRLAARQQR